MANVILIMSDAHRGDFLGCEDGGVTITPQLDRLASQGMRFRRAYCQAPLCCPSRQSIISGRYPSNSGCFTNLHQLPAGTPTFVGALRSSGYRTAVVGKSHMEIHRFDSDLLSDPHRRYMESLGFCDICEISGAMMRTGIACAYSDFLRREGMFDVVLDHHRRWNYFMEQGGDPHHFVHEFPFDERFDESRFVTDRALGWLDTHGRSAPFFLQVGYYQPNHPRDPLSRFMDPYRSRTEPEPLGAVAPMAADARASRQSYRAEISQVDDYVGEIVRRVADLGLADQTYILYTSDHGCTLYERNGMDGTFTGEAYANFFEASVHVPLIIAGPQVRRNVVSASLVELIDLGATICDLAGVRPQALDQGRSLGPLLRGEAADHRASAYAEMACDRMLIAGDRKIMRGDPTSDRRPLWQKAHLDRPVNIAPARIRLFDLAEDPAEARDLADSRPDLIARLNEEMLIRINENTQMQPWQSRGEYRPVASGDHKGATS